MIQCFDDDCSSYVDQFVDGASNSDAVSIAVASDGAAYMAFDYGTDALTCEGDVCDYYSQGVGLATCTAGGCSTSRLAPISIYTAMTTAVTVGPDGTPMVAYVNEGVNYPDPVPESINYCLNGTCAQIALTSGDDLDLATGPDGFARLVFSNNDLMGVDFLKCEDQACSNSTIHTIANHASAGVALSVPGDGEPIVASEGYSGDYDLHYVRCSSVDCSTYDDDPIQDQWSYAMDLAMAKTSDGLGRIIARNSQQKMTHVRKTVSVKLSQRFGDSDLVSPDDAAQDGPQGYIAQTGSPRLGRQISTGIVTGCGIGFEMVGNVSPADYQGRIVIHRLILRKTLFKGQIKIGDVRNADDTSDPPLRDDDPQSGGSAGKVYDLDFPGSYSLSSTPYRYRSNFYTWASLDDASPQKPWGTRISSFFPFYVRESCAMGNNGYQFNYDISGDNQIGIQTTYNSWDLGPSDLK